MKGRLLCGVAAMAFGFGLAATGPAVAFSDVQWSWDKDKWQTVDINTWIWSFFHPEGETEVQKTQIYVGDVTAVASLMGDYVPQTVESLEATVDFTVTWSGTQDDDPNPSVFGTGILDGGNAVLGGDLSGEGPLVGTLHEGTDALELSAEFTGITVNLDPLLVDLTQEAVDGLGHAVQGVSAVGIADSIYSEFPVYAHETQILLGAEDLNSIEPEGDDFLEILGNVAMDMIRKSNITAVATAGAWYNPVEIAIDQDVSAVAAALSIDLEANNAPALIQTVNEDEGFFGDMNVDTGDTIVENRCDFCSPEYGVFYPVVTNNIVEADITQFAYADVVASARTYQDLTAFTNLGAYNRLGERGLVANQSVTAAGLVASVTNKIKEVTP